MRIQPYQANNIVIGQARILGGIVAGDKTPAWILPGGLFTLSEGRAKEVAKRINKLMA